MRGLGVAAMILAGGLGTRLRAITGDRYPKPMAPVPCGQGTYPFLEFVLSHFRRQGITDFVLCIGHLGDQIKQHFADGSRFGVKILYDDAGDADTGLRVLHALRHIDSPVFLVICGDTFHPIAVGHFLCEFDRHHDWQIQLAAISTKGGRLPNITMEADGRVAAYGPAGDFAGRAGLETGTMLVRRPALEGFSADKDFSLTTDVYSRLIQRRALGSMIVDTEFFDIGTPEGYNDFCKFVAAGGARPVSMEPDPGLNQ